MGIRNLWDRFKAWRKAHWRFFLATKGGVLLSLLLFAFNRLDLSFDVYMTLDPVFFSLAVFFFVVWQFSLGARWGYCLRLLEGERTRTSFTKLMTIIWLGNLIAISILPSIIGQDAVKLAKWRDLSDSLKRVTQSIIMTHLVGAYGIVFSGLLCLFILSVFVPVIPAFAGRAFQLLTIIALILSTLFALLHRPITSAIDNWVAKGISHGKLQALWETLVRLDWKLILAGGISQALFILSTACAYMSVGNLMPIVAISMTGAAAMGRLIPLTFLGISAGEGLMYYFLSNVNWQIEEIILGASIPVLLIFFSGALGLILEMLNLKEQTIIAT